MSSTTERPNLIIFPGGKTEHGPVTRMGLWHKFSKRESRVWLWVAFTKGILLAAVLYVIFG